MQSKGANGWQPEKWSYLKRSRTVINEIIALGTLIHVHALGGDLSSPFDLCECMYAVCVCVCTCISLCVCEEPMRSADILFEFSPLLQSFSLTANSKDFLSFFLTCFLISNSSRGYGTRKVSEEQCKKRKIQGQRDNQQRE